MEKKMHDFFYYQSLVKKNNQSLFLSYKLVCYELDYLL